MEFPIKIMVIVMICLITFLILASVMGGWGSQTSNFLEGLFNFFAGLFGGGALPAGGG